MHVVAQSPPAVVRHLHADERALQTATGARFVAVARDRQLLLRIVAAEPKVAAAVIRLAPGEGDDLAFRRDFNALSAQSPPQVGGVSLGPARHASRLRSFYREAQRRFEIRWQLLAAINFVESDFGRERTTAIADAQGPMQFEPATWRAYGLGGNVYDEHDAVLGAANLLAANGGRTNERAALRHYNLSPLYWDAVLHLAHRMETVPTAFREYYAWEAYVAPVPGTVERTIRRRVKRAFRWTPAFVPAGDVYSHIERALHGNGFSIFFDRRGGPKDDLGFNVLPVRSCKLVGTAMRTFTVLGTTVRWSATYEDQQAWRCIASTEGTVAILVTQSHSGGDDPKSPRALDLAKVAASARPVR